MVIYNTYIYMTSVYDMPTIFNQSVLIFEENTFL